MWKHYLATEITEHCTTARNPFSVITSSHPHEGLAGILAGFMMTATAFILGKQKEIVSTAEPTAPGMASGKVRVPTQTLTLFGVGVLILGLDAYLYGLITGVAPPFDSHRNVVNEAAYACGVAWSQAMPAGSMLAVGGCFMMAGLGWMLAWSIGFHDVRSKAVAYVPGTITGITILTTSLMLVRNANLYANFMAEFDVVISPIWRWMIWGASAVLALWVVTVVGFRTVGLLMRIEDSDSDLEAMLSLRSTPLALATLGGALLALIGPAGASIMTDTGWLRDSNTGLPSTAGVVLGMLLSVLPAFAISGPLAFAVPGPGIKDSWRDVKQWRRQRRERGCRRDSVAEPN